METVLLAGLRLLNTGADEEQTTVQSWTVYQWLWDSRGSTFRNSVFSNDFNEFSVFAKIGSWRYRTPPLIVSFAT
jgi:hypothetical protein